MQINFQFILFTLTVATGIIYLIDKLFWEKARKDIADNEKALKPNMIAEFSRSFFGVFFIVLLIRSFLVSPFYVPTGSLEPTIIPTEFVLVNQFAYGLKLPVWNIPILPLGHPKRGEIALFRWPVNQNLDLIKRVIGMPGDRISYINKILYINGQPAQQTLLGSTIDSDGTGNFWQVKEIEENLLGIKHKIYVCADNTPNCPNPTKQNFYNLVVPKNEYFMMGDNRDNSDDSRDWGFVPANNLIGKGIFIFMSWDPIKHDIRWRRIGTIL